jgi:chromosome segregation ATPase
MRQRKVKITPEKRKKVVSRRASIVKKLIDARAQKAGIVEALGEARQREARFRTTAKRLANTLERQNATLGKLTSQLEKLKDTVTAVKGNISAKKLRTKPTSPTQLAILSKTQKQIPTTRKQISALKKDIRQNETSQKFNGNNLRAVQSEVKTILKDGDRINARIKKLTGK